MARALCKPAGGPGHLLVVAVAAFAVCLPGAAATTGLPALVDPASQERHGGKMIFAQLVTPNLSDAERFYGGLFGWTFREVPVRGTRYAAASLDGMQVAGLIEKPIPPGGGRRPSWLTFISTGDVDATTSLAVRYGAKELFAPRTIPELGRESVLADPQGAVFATLASSSGDPPDVLADDGIWIWSSLLAGDPMADAAFYRVVFGYTVYEESSATAAGHLILASENYARASVNPLPAGRPDFRPRWVNYLRVGDVAAAVSKAVSLGGRVLVAPHEDRAGQPVAVVADPQGAAFGLMEWSGEQPGEDAK